MNPQVIDVRGRSAAAPSAVYALLRDGAAWPSFSPIDRFELERGGDLERELALQYRSYAQATLPSSVRTRALLERIAASWERDAQSEDKEGAP